MASLSASKAVSLGADAAYLIARPPPDAPDGLYDWQVSSDAADQKEGHSTTSNFINRAETLVSKGQFKPDPKVLAGVTDSFLHPDAVDDRKGVFETALGIMARVDPTTDVAMKLNDTIIGGLYDTVPHPPAAYLGPKYAWRQADGSNNSLQDPDCGRSGRPYARSVQARSSLPVTSLPDPGLVFDTLLKKRDHKIHPGGMSSMIFAFASIVTHSLFRTDFKDWTINNASSYLDLSPLYGDNQADQDRVRDKDQGRGLLYPDTFHEERLLFLPPATSALLVLFSRNHNYIADKILKINERKRWTNPPPTDPAARALQDEEIFQTARLINGGHFMTMITGDYAASFLGSSENCNWNMNPFDPIKRDDLVVDRGRGNHCSVEFNVLYRWHATTSAVDEKWTEDVFNSAFGGKPFDQLSLRDLSTIGKIFADVPADPSKRTFAGLKRGPDGKFSDDDLANVLHSATSNPAGTFRGRGTPPVLRLVEIMGMEQARRWGVCTMNEFRKFLGLKQFESFEEWNPDPEIADAARRLYGHVDNLELYPGLQAEPTIPVVDGMRFACGYTTTRAVLGDAIALVRGDRFYTTDFTRKFSNSYNLTTWGFHDCQRHLDNGGGGGQMPKLLMRNLPRHYPWNSSYSLWPFFTPDHMKQSLTRQGISEKYTFDRPIAQPVPVVLKTFAAIKAVWSDPSRFKVIYEKKGYGCMYPLPMLFFDDAKQHDADRALVLHALFPTQDSINQYAAWCRAETVKLIQERSWNYDGAPGTYVDIVNGVINNVAIHFSAEKILGIELKTKSNPRGLHTERELYAMAGPWLMSLFRITFLAFDEPESKYALNEAASSAGGIIGLLATKAVTEVAPSTVPNPVGRLLAGAKSYIWPESDKPWYPFLSDLASTGRSLDALVGNIIGLAVGSSVNFAQGAVHVVDFYLDDARAKERNEIIRLAQKDDAQSTELLQGYVREAMRFNPQFTGLWRDVAVDATIPQGGNLPPIKVKAGDRIWGSFRTAHLNPDDFPNPQAVDPRRPKASYNLNGTGFHNCPGTTYAQVAITEMIKPIFSLKNLRRAAGDAGVLAGYHDIIRETETNVYVNRDGTTGPWPGSLYVQVRLSF
ncbi:heme peroxidase [Pleurotus eryngii]|uniref:Heme peroxidase n=1 Tax=Pleurotus eryngii TaxID=5323 RepID=A0A9P6A643_PLEER|nr:heme peroxidase [Pleurotus eryngii]